MISKIPLRWRYLLFFCLGNIAVLLCVHFALDRDSGLWSGWQKFFVPEPLMVAARAGQSEELPWGNLEVEQMPLADLVGEMPDQSRWLQQPAWRFESLTEEQLTRFLKKCELNTSQLRTVLNKKYWETIPGGFVIRPPATLVASLSADSRKRMYEVLAKCGDNYPQEHPYRFNGDEFEQVLRQSGVDRWSAARLRSLAYTNSGVVFFADHYVAQDLVRPGIFESFQKTVSKITPAYNIRLRVDHDADVNKLAKYWGKGGRENQVLPILQSLSRLPGGGAINVGYLLPPFPRSRLYTYPYNQNDPHSEDEDCFFSSFVFFSSQVDTNFYSVEYANKVVVRDYRVVSETPTFGDLITLVNPQGDLVHMCVYVADNFVFTKNGIGRTQPWVLMRLADVSALYFGQGHPGKTVIIRRKENLACN